MDKKQFDCIVIGVGSMGASACYNLAKRGYEVLGIEQFDIGHEFGSHAGQSRIIRKAYFEHSDYVPLLHKAYENWKQLEEETGEQLYFKTGLLYSGRAENEMIKGAKQSAALYNIDLDKWDLPSLSDRFPSFKLPDDFEILYEPDAGFLPPEKSIRLYADWAKRNGATIHTHEKIISWNKDGDGIRVKTDKAIYHCGKLIITAGAWAGKIIPAFSSNIKVTRQFVSWIQPCRTGSSGQGNNEKLFALNNFPCWMIADDDKHGCYYGFPVLPTEKFGEPAGLKLAHHYPAQITDPDNVNRQTTEDDIENIKYCLNKYLPGVFDGVLSSKVCLYGNSPDENFIIDKLPGHEETVVVACGFSGHGFKFASVVGEILADLAIDGNTDLPVEFLNAKRFS